MNLFLVEPESLSVIGEQSMLNESACREVAEVHGAVDMNVVVERILERMNRAGFSAKDLFGVRVALEEAMVNARQHGNGGDQAKAVWVSYYVTPSETVVQIEDQGLAALKRATSSRRRAYSEVRSSSATSAGRTLSSIFMW